MQTKTNAELCSDGSCAYSPHLSSSLASAFRWQDYKANRVERTLQGLWVNTGCCDEWTCVVDIPDAEPSGVIFLEMFESLTQGSPVEPWQPNKLASIAACGDLWPRGFQLPCRDGRFEEPSWFNNIFSPGAAKALSCLTPVAPSPRAPTQLLLSIRHPVTTVRACCLDTWMQQQAVRLLEVREISFPFGSLRPFWVKIPFVLLVCKYIRNSFNAKSSKTCENYTS